MTRGGTRQIAALIAVVFALAPIAACGDSDSETGASSTSTTAQGGEEGSTGAQGTGSQAEKGSGKDGQPQGSSDGEERVSTPLKVSGGGSEQFRFKGGDNSIQEYGEESDEAELQEVAEVVHGFYVARAEEDWSKACTYLAKAMVGRLEALAGSSPELKKVGCGPILKAFTRPLPASVRRETTVVDAGSFRRDDERGFLIYYDSEDKPYAIPLEDDDGEWGLTLLSATPLG